MKFHFLSFVTALLLSFTHQNPICRVMHKNKCLEHRNCSGPDPSFLSDASLLQTHHGLSFFSCCHRCDSSEQETMRILLVIAMFAFILSLVASRKGDDTERRKILRNVLFDNVIEASKGLYERKGCGHLRDPCTPGPPSTNTCCIGLQCRYGKCLVQVGR